MRGRCNDKEHFIKIFEQSQSISDIGRKLGYKLKGNACPGGVHKLIKSKIVEYGLDDTHLKGMGWSKGFTSDNNASLEIISQKRSKPWTECFKLNSKIHNQSLLKRLVKSGKREYKCELCGINEWNGKMLVLELHHINEKFYDNREENLQIICPNCHSQTRIGKNSLKGLRFLIKRDFNLDIIKQEINEPKCHKPKVSHFDTNWRHRPKEDKRKVKRPTKEELSIMLENEPMTKIGKKFGVSDNAIRKWAKAYGLLK